MVRSRNCSVSKRLATFNPEIAFSEEWSKRYGVHLLVWYEVHKTMESEIQRDKRMKGWKLELFERFNPDGQDLFRGIL